MKTSKIIIMAVAVFVAVVAGIAGAFFYFLIYPVAVCTDFTKPSDAVKACTAVMHKYAMIENNNDDTIATEAHLVIWLHLAHIHEGQDDQKEFEANAAPYLNEKWPAPIITLFEGKTTVDEVYAKAKLGVPDDVKDQAFEVNYYVGEWYLQKNMKDEARKAFHAAYDICSFDQIERGSLKDELKALGP